MQLAIVITQEGCCRATNGDRGPIWSKEVLGKGQAGSLRRDLDEEFVVSSQAPLVAGDHLLFLSIGGPLGRTRDERKGEIT